MKISRKQLKRIIREAVGLLNESASLNKGILSFQGKKYKLHDPDGVEGSNHLKRLEGNILVVGVGPYSEMEFNLSTADLSPDGSSLTLSGAQGEIMLKEIV